MFLTQKIFDDLCKEYELIPCPSLYVMRVCIGGGVEVDEATLRKQMSISRDNIGNYALHFSSF